MRDLLSTQESAMSIAPTASEGSLEGLLARMHAAAGAQTPTAQVSTAGAAPQLPEFGQGGQSHGTPPHGTPPAAAAANDLGRVMQWAGTELLLRDQKVRHLWLTAESPHPSDLFPQDFPTCKGFCQTEGMRLSL